MLNNMLLFYYGLLWLLWTQRFSPITDEPFNYLIICNIFYQLTTFYYLFEYVSNGHDRSKPCEIIDL